MSFYNLTKAERKKEVNAIESALRNAIDMDQLSNMIRYFSDPDTYIRRSAYLAIGRICKSDVNLLPKVIKTLENLNSHGDFKVRLTLLGKLVKHNSRL